MGPIVSEAITAGKSEKSNEIKLGISGTLILNSISTEEIAARSARENELSHIEYDMCLVSAWICCLCLHKNHPFYICSKGDFQLFAKK